MAKGQESREEKLKSLKDNYISEIVGGWGGGRIKVTETLNLHLKFVRVEGVLFCFPPEAFLAYTSLKSSPSPLGIEGQADSLGENVQADVFKQLP